MSSATILVPPDSLAIDIPTKSLAVIPSVHPLNIPVCNPVYSVWALSDKVVSINFIEIAKPVNAVK